MPKLQEKHILVTGGAGFIGSNFLHYIRNQEPDLSLLNVDKLTYAGNLENLHRMLRAGFHDDLYRTARAVAAAVFTDLLADPTDGATHYHAARVTPGWADPERETARLGDHVFYAL